MDTPHDLAVSIGKNTFFGVVAKAAQVITRLATIPMVIAHLGVSGYGIWAIIMSIAAYMRFGSVGVKSAFQKYVAEGTGKGDYRSANQLLSTGCALMLGISVGLIPAAIFSKRLAVAAGVPPEFLNSAANAISVLALIMGLANVGAVFEAIVMGGQRIDIARNLTTVFTILEAIAIIIILHLGHGLFGMAVVMAASEVGFVSCCAIASRRVVPEIELARKHVTRAVIPELVRFAGTYQLVNLLEILYTTTLPIAILNSFGARASGVYALVTRLTACAQILPEALLLPILSGSAMVFASRSVEKTHALILNSFKVVLILSVFPLIFIASFGGTLIFAWTGQVDLLFPKTLWIVSAAALFQSISLLQLVLYRASGRATLDNVRQVLRVISLLAIASMANALGFFGVLTGTAVAELLGMIFMLFAIARTFHVPLFQLVVSDTIKMGIAALGFLTAGTLALYIPMPSIVNERMTTTLHMTAVALACVVSIWPALRLTRVLNGTDGRAVLSVFMPTRRQAEFVGIRG